MGRHRYLVRGSGRNRHSLNADPGLIPEATAHATSVRSAPLKIDVVGEDEGDAGYSEPPYGDAAATPVAAGTPGVVSITRVLGGTGFASAATGAFDVRIILTEEPKEFTADHIIVQDENGTASAPVAGLPIKGGVGTNGTARTSGDSDYCLCWRRLWC